MRSRRLSLLLAIMIILSLLPQLAIPAQAAYENTYKNTGDQRADIIGVALTQVGYLEGDGKSNNNKNKYSEYFGYGARSWCGDFVSWCARQADIPKSVLKNSGPAKPSTFGITTVHKSGYTPKPGDLFFKYKIVDGKVNYSHVGIVYYISGKYFYTIEGNTWPDSPRKDGVYIRKRLISDFYFGVPNYAGESGSSGSTACDHSYNTDYDSAHPHKEFKICSKCSYKTYTGKDKTVSTCKTCIQEGCEHDYTDWKESSSTKHKKTCSKCGKTVSEKHSWSAYEVITEPTCNKAGKKVRTCKYCGAEESKKISPTGEHFFSDVEYIDKKYHGQTCFDCGKVYKTKHTVTKDYAADGKNHWLYCEDCGERYDIALHSYESGCGSECKICDYTSPFTHELSESHISDAESHWKLCQLCNLAVGSQPHVFTSDCDQICDLCDYARTTDTQHTLVTKNDDQFHWSECAVCGQVQDKLPHSPDETAKDWEDQNCLSCSYVLRSADLHEHSYESIEYNRQMHWGTCACGEQLPQEPHRFSMESGDCSVCHAISSPLGAQYDYDWIWMVAVAAFGGLIAIMILILFIRSFRRRRI